MCAASRNFSPKKDYHSFDHENQTKPLHYLRDHTEDEIKALEEKFDLTRYEMEDIIENNYETYCWYFTKYCMASLINLLFPLYGGDQNRIGLQRSVSTLVPNANVPDSIASPVGNGLAWISTGYFMLAISPSHLAVRFTLEYATQTKDLCDLMEEFFDGLTENPRNTLSCFAQICI